MTRKVLNDASGVETVEFALVSLGLFAALFLVISLAEVAWISD